MSWQELDEQLYMAAGRGDTAGVQACLQYGASPTAAYSLQHRLPLHAAAEGNHVEVVQLLLLREPVCIDAQDASGCTALHLACECGSREVFELLLEHGASPDIKDRKGWTALHGASYRGRVEMAQQLLMLPQMQALVNAPAGKGNTPLHLACRQGHSQVAQMLVAAGATLHAQTKGSATPMYGAIAGRHAATVGVLLAAGAHPAAAIKGSQTGLHIAAQHGLLDVLKQLLAAMAAKPASSSSTSTSNTSSSSTNSSSGDGVDVAHAGMTALQVAVEYRQSRCAEALLAAGASADMVYGTAAETAMGQSIAGATMLHRAVEHACTPVMLVRLLATPANVSAVWRDQTPLQLALCVRNAEAARALLAAGAFKGLPAASKATAMTLAAVSFSPGVRELLPLMVRHECERYKQLVQENAAYEQLQQETQSNKQLQQGKRQRGPTQPPPQPKPQDPETVMAAVARAVTQLLRNTDAAGDKRRVEEGPACFRMALEVLGVAGAGKLVTLLMPGAITGDNMRFAAELVGVVHAGWLAAEGEIMQWRLIHMQRVLALLQRQGGVVVGGATASESWQQVARSTEQLGARYEALRCEAVAAAGARDWVLFVQHLEQLTALNPARTTALLFGGAMGEAWGFSIWSECDLQWYDKMRRVCEALLDSWRTAPARAAPFVQPVADAVVSVVQTWQQQPRVVRGAPQL